MPSANELIYHMCLRAEWELAVQSGVYGGSSQDGADGFIHFSTGAQVPESARKHRAGQKDLVLLAVATEALGEALRWESSRGGALFPHLYGVLPISAVRCAVELPLGPDGVPLVSIALANSSGSTGLVKC
jgi:uncharacterized protein (DUF952 family)